MMMRIINKTPSPFATLATARPTTGGRSAGAIGFPQWGHASALSETSRPHSGHSISAIYFFPRFAARSFGVFPLGGRWVIWFFFFLGCPGRHRDHRVRLGPTTKTP